MTDRELDALIAEKVMCLVWDEKRCRVCGWMMLAEGEVGCHPDRCSMVWEGPRPPRADEPDFYSTDRNAAALVLERIGELGLQEDFLHFLHNLPMKTWSATYAICLWERLTASPRQLMEAALACVLAKSEEGKHA